MPEDQAVAAPVDNSALLQQLLQQTLSQPQAPTGARAQVAQPSSFVGLLGSAIGGGGSGAVPMSADESEASGRKALLSFGLNLLQNSGYRSDRPTIGQLIGGGIGAAQQSIGGSEELKAARGQAQQEYAQSQQEMKLARIKEALPLLTAIQQQQLLQQRAGMPNPLAGGPPSIAAAGASADVPAELMPIYQAAAARTGIPVEVLIAQHKQESGFNNALTGKAGEIGIGQILPSTAASPGFGMKPVDPKALRDPATNINFAADYLRAHIPEGADPKNPAVIEAALKAYNGGGDPNYVANVKRYLPGQKPAAPAAPVAAPTAHPDTTQPDVAPAAPGNLVAGPGAPSNLVAKPAGPNVPGDVNAIIQGMTGAGADHTTLKPPTEGTPGGSVPPASQIATAGPTVPVPQPPVPGQTTPPAPDTRPDAALTFNEFRGRHAWEPTPQEQANWQVTPDPKSLQDARASQQAAAQELALARRTPGGDPTKALSAYNVATDAVNKLVQEAQIKTVENRNSWFEKQTATLKDIYNPLVAQAATAAEADKQRQAAIDLKKLEGSQQENIERIKAGQTWHQKLQEQAATTAQTNVIGPMSAAASKAHQMNMGLEQMLPVLQDLPKGGGPLGAVLDKHPDLAPLFNTAGILNDKQADAVRLVNGLVANISTEMKPAGLGALREYEWDAFKAQLPNMLSTPAGQQKAVAFLVNMNNRIKSEHSWMSNYFSRKVPDETTPGKMVPAHNLESDDPSESVQQRMDRELGPLIPRHTGPLTGSAQSQWEQSLAPGKPYYKTWAVPDPANPGQPKRDAQGNVMTTTTLEIRPWR